MSTKPPRRSERIRGQARQLPAAPGQVGEKKSESPQTEVVEEGPESGPQAVPSATLTPRPTENVDLRTMERRNPCTWMASLLILMFLGATVWYFGRGSLPHQGLAVTSSPLKAAHLARICDKVKQHHKELRANESTAASEATGPLSDVVSDMTHTISQWNTYGTDVYTTLMPCINEAKMDGSSVDLQVVLSALEQRPLLAVSVSVSKASATINSAMQSITVLHTQAQSEVRTCWDILRPRRWIQILPILRWVFPKPDKIPYDTYIRCARIENGRNGLAQSRELLLEADEQMTVQRQRLSALENGLIESSGKMLLLLYAWGPDIGVERAELKQNIFCAIAQAIELEKDKGTFESDFGASTLGAGFTCVDI